MNRKSELILSMADLSAKLRQLAPLFLLVAFFFGLLSFCYLVRKPIHYTAEAIFKTTSAQIPSSIYNVMQIFAGDEHYMPNDESRSFLRSYAVLEHVVRELNLQAAILGNPCPGKIREIGYTLKTAYMRRQLKRKRPASQILSHGVDVTEKLIIPDPVAHLMCSQVEFNSETSQKLAIKCSNDSFRVFSQGKMIGSGQLNRPFVWDKGSLTLTGNPKKGRTYYVELIPLEQAILSLQKTVSIRRDKENGALLHISYTHRDRHLAARIVNGVMEGFERYLQNEGKKKITKQLDYLQQRQSETTALLEEVLEKHKRYLESHLDTGSILSLERELQFMTDQQASIKLKMLNTQIEMEHLTHHALPFADLLTQLRQDRANENLQTLTLEGAKNLILGRQQELDALYLDQEIYDYCLGKLQESQFDCASLSKILNSEGCRTRFEKIESIHHHLVDSKHWSSKEREQLKGDLETEKQFIIHYLNNLKEGNFLKEKTLQGRIASLEKNLIFLLLDRFEQEERGLKALAEQATQFPQKWLNQQKIGLNTELYTQMILSITELIEAKNIGYNLDYLMSSRFKTAYPPTLPNCPKFLQGTLLGAGGGLVLAFLILCGYTIWLGPSASTANLKSRGHKILPEDIPTLGLEIEEYGPIILISSPRAAPFLPSLLRYLSKKGENPFVIDLASALPPECLLGKEREAFLASTEFQDLLAQYAKTFRPIFLITRQPVGSFEFRLLSRFAHVIIYGIAQERLENLEGLPKATFFYTASEEGNPLSLNAIKPHLEELMIRFKGSSFSSQPSAWSRFPSESFSENWPKGT